MCAKRKTVIYLRIYFHAPKTNFLRQTHIDGSKPGFYTKLNVWGSLGLNFEYDGGPIIEIGGPIFLYKLRILEGITVVPRSVILRAMLGPLPIFLGGHLKFLRATYYHQ